MLHNPMSSSINICFAFLDEAPKEEMIYRWRKTQLRQLIRNPGGFISLTSWASETPRKLCKHQQVRDNLKKCNPQKT